MLDFGSYLKHALFVDDDECLRPGACGQNAQCFNNIGSYTCSCLEGYTGNPLHSCVG